ncbi:MAG TPA: hypothetical protein VER32_09160 [Pyrinomonadaceae bacterium]|nr:hypothetical protein [Pyrinomonadaceae bacterium]
MRRSTLCAMALAALCLFLWPQEARAQYAYGISAIEYDSNTKEVFGYSATEVDYSAGFYYDPYVEGFMYGPFGLIDYGSSRGYESYFPAQVFTYTFNALPNSEYDVISDHYVIRWFSVDIIIYDDDCYYYFMGCYGYNWYDPYGFSFLPGGNFGPYNYFWGWNYYGYVPEWTTYVGTTAVGIFTPPDDPCSSSTADKTDYMDMSAEGGDFCEPMPSVTIGAINAVSKHSVTNETFTVPVEVSPSNNSVPITLSLRTTSGSGSAVFAANNSTSLTITQTTNVEIKGQNESSTVDNIRLEAKARNRTRDTEDFTVVLVTFQFRTSGTLSSDNAARAYIAQQIGTDSLGLFQSTGLARRIWRHNVEIVGVVRPSNYRDPIVLQRNVLQARRYVNNDPNPQFARDNFPDTTDDPNLVDTDPQSGGSNGRVFDYDAPGIGFGSPPANGTILRARTNFRQWATAGGVRVSDYLYWYQRLSIRQTSNGVVIDNSQNGDNAVGEGTTDIGLGTPRTRFGLFIAQNVPDTMEAGQAYNVSVTMMNGSDHTWTPGEYYRLGSQNPHDNTYWGLGRVDVPGPVAPGQEVTFNFTVVAPSSPGYYNFQWRMLREWVEWFGDWTPNVVVNVTSPYTYCDWYQEQSCYNNGGSWDYSTCTCYGGCGYYGGYCY